MSTPYYWTWILHFSPCFLNWKSSKDSQLFKRWPSECNIWSELQYPIPLVAILKGMESCWKTVKSIHEIQPSLDEKIRCRWSDLLTFFLIMLIGWQERENPVKASTEIFKRVNFRLFNRGVKRLNAS